MWRSRPRGRCHPGLDAAPGRGNRCAQGPESPACPRAGRARIKTKPQFSAKRSGPPERTGSGRLWGIHGRPTHHIGARTRPQPPEWPRYGGKKRPKSWPDICYISSRCLHTPALPQGYGRSGNPVVILRRLSTAIGWVSLRPAAGAGWCGMSLPAGLTLDFWMAGHPAGPCVNPGSCPGAGASEQQESGLGPRRQIPSLPAHREGDGEEEQGRPDLRHGLRR